MIPISTYVSGVAGVTVMFLLVAAGTGILVYHFISQPKYVRQDDTIVEEFKEWKHENMKQNSLYRAISSIVNSVALLIFLLLGFFWGGWFYAWIVFVIGAVINRIIRSCMELGEKR